MNRLNIVDRSAYDLGDQLGIDQERRDFLSKQLDHMVKMVRSGDAKLVYVAEIINWIRGICETEEEYTWCLMLHMQWMFRTGRMLKPYTKK